MFDNFKNIIIDIINEYPNSYIWKIRKLYPELNSWLNEKKDINGYLTFGESLYNWLFDNIDKTCICGNNTKFKQFSHGYFEYCSYSCRAKAKQSFMNAHNTDGTCKGIEKIKSSIEIAIKKRKQTIIDRYGISMNVLCSERSKKLFYKKLPSELKSYDFCSEYKGTAKDLAEQLLISDSTVRNAFKLHKIKLQRQKSGRSKQEIEIYEFLKVYRHDIQHNIRGLLGDKRREIDIFIPGLKLGIEYCGLFWHSDRNNYHKNTHQKKFIDAKSMGIKLITIFEDEWLFKKDIVESRLRSIIGESQKIDANLCSIMVTNEYEHLLNSWHILGSIYSTDNICLKYKDEIVAIMTYNKYIDYVEITRFAMKNEIMIVDGFEKILNHLISDSSIKSIISHSDNRWGFDAIFDCFGFVEESITQPLPSYFMIVEKNRLNQCIFMKKNIKNLIKDVDLDEYKNMKLLGYNRIFDCGSIRLIKNM